MKRSQGVMSSYYHGRRRKGQQKIIAETGLRRLRCGGWTQRNDCTWEVLKDQSKRGCQFGGIARRSEGKKSCAFSKRVLPLSQHHRLLGTQKTPCAGDDDDDETTDTGKPPPFADTGNYCEPDKALPLNKMSQSRVLNFCSS